VSVYVPVLLAEPGLEAGLAAGFEEESVPVRFEQAQGDAVSLARNAARASPLGLGVGADRERLVLVLAAAPGRPYLDAPATATRAFGQAAARVAARRPLATPLASRGAPRAG
jgi:hypothetical protein